MDELTKKVEELLKSLLSIKTGASKDLMVPAIKAPSLKVPKPSIKQPTAGKIPSGLPPPSKKDPAKVAQQLKNPNPGKVNVEVLKIENNGQWSLSKTVGTTDKTPVINATPIPAHALPIEQKPISASTHGFKDWHLPEQNKMIDGLNIGELKPMHGSAAGGAKTGMNPNHPNNLIVKRAADHANQEARGHLQNGFNSARREVLFHNLARDGFGMGKYVPTTAGFTYNGQDYSVQDMKHNAAHHALMNATVKPDEHSSHNKILNDLHSSGELHKLALMDNIMGHHDRHGNNYMMDKNGDGLHLIDNGTAFDYGNFDNNEQDGGKDTKHYPAYLKHSQNAYIKGLGLDNSTLHPEAVKWLNNLDSGKFKTILAAHGHDENSPVTQGLLRRLEGMKNAVKNGKEHYKSIDNLLAQNRLTTGPLYKHPPPKQTPGVPQW